MPARAYDILHNFSSAYVLFEEQKKKKCKFIGVFEAERVIASREDMEVDGPYNAPLLLPSRGAREGVAIFLVASCLRNTDEPLGSFDPLYCMEQTLTLNTSKS